MPSVNSWACSINCCFSTDHGLSCVKSKWTQTSNPQHQKTYRSNFVQGSNVYCSKNSLVKGSTAANSYPLLRGTNLPQRQYLAWFWWYLRGKSTGENYLEGKLNVFQKGKLAYNTSVSWSGILCLAHLCLWISRRGKRKILSYYHIHGMCIELFGIDSLYALQTYRTINLFHVRWYTTSLPGEPPNEKVVDAC